MRIISVDLRRYLWSDGGMSHILFFHSAVGLDDGVHAMAQTLRDAGHTVTTPDYYDGRTFDTAEQGIAYRDEVGFRTLVDRVNEAIEDIEGPVVAAGISLGSAMAQRLGKKDPRVRAALLLHAGGEAKPVDWPTDCALQMHYSVNDPWIDEGMPEHLLRSAARAGARTEHYLYPGASHLFADPTKPDYVKESADLMWDRVLGLLTDLDES